MSATNPGKVRAHTTPATNIKQLKDVTLGAMAIQEPDAVAVTGGTIHGAAVSSSKSQTITEADAISLAVNHVKITGPATSTYAVTLAAPSRAGQLLIIEMLDTTATNAVTLALTNVVGGTQASTATFNAAAETLVLLSNSTKWVVIKEQGVTLS